MFILGRKSAIVVLEVLILKAWSVTSILILCCFISVYPYIFFKVIGIGFLCLPFLQFFTLLCKEDSEDAT